MSISSHRSIFMTRALFCRYNFPKHASKRLSYTYNFHMTFVCLVLVCWSLLQILPANLLFSHNSSNWMKWCPHRFSSHCIFFLLLTVSIKFSLQMMPGSSSKLRSCKPIYLNCSLFILFSTSQSVLQHLCTILRQATLQNPWSEHRSPSPYRRTQTSFSFELVMIEKLKIHSCRQLSISRFSKALLPFSKLDTLYTTYI